ncbi:hypothetical protein J7K42_01030 [bacterium]|nr:hypothetical protein [bacterium]
MKKTLKILAFYTVLISLYSIITNFSMLGQEITINQTIALTTLVTLIPVIIFSALVLSFLKGKSEKTEKQN